MKMLKKLIMFMIIVICIVSVMFIFKDHVQELFPKLSGGTQLPL